MGARFYSKNGLGALVDVDYRFDMNADDFLNIFGTTYTTDFTVAHAGYAYRHVIASRRDPGLCSYCPMAATPLGGLPTRIEWVYPFDVEGLDVGDVSGGEDEAVDLGFGREQAVDGWDWVGGAHFAPSAGDGESDGEDAIFECGD